MPDDKIAEISDDVRITENDNEWLSFSVQKIYPASSEGLVSVKLTLLTLVYWGAPLMENQIKLIGYFTDEDSATRHAATLNLEVIE